MNPRPDMLAISAEVSEFLEPSIQSTVDSISGDFCGFLPANSVCILLYPRTLLLTDREQIAFLVGGFATSPWLSEQLQSRLLGLGFQVRRPDEHTWVTIDQFSWLGRDLTLVILQEQGRCHRSSFFLR